jgi:hypothetical protein
MASISRVSANFFVFTHPFEARDVCNFLAYEGGL